MNYSPHVTFKAMSLLRITLTSYFFWEKLVLQGKLMKVMAIQEYTAGGNSQRGEARYEKVWVVTSPSHFVPKMLTGFQKPSYLEGPLGPEVI